MLQLVIRDGGRHSITHLVKNLDIPNATVYRLLATLTEQGLLQPARRGHYIAGPGLLSLTPYLQPSHIAAELARKSLSSLAASSGAIVHMGMLEDDMVTYLVKEGRGNDQLFTREGMQLEAYCTGIGKVLLAGLPPDQQSQYLANGPFVALTPNTTVDVNTLRAELEKVKDQRFAVDNREISPDLYCLAVPVPSNESAISLGISVSRLGGEVDQSNDAVLIASMYKTANEIADILSRDGAT
ncbi:MAG: IclR family transcriptional regulator [Parasphingorhabdus sp.]|uniref:IclR family transcriptional regulator n=1 Tax=Parasphingorhabdus sp. TaxID=2709688 RepID=UPI0030017DA5